MLTTNTLYSGLPPKRCIKYRANNMVKRRSVFGFLIEKAMLIWFSYKNILEWLLTTPLFKRRTMFYPSYVMTKNENIL